MQKWLWVLLALIVSSGIYFSIRYGLRPKPIPIMKPTVFSSMEEMGVVTYRRLRQQIRSEKVIVLGVDYASPGSQDFPMGLVKAAVADKVKIQSVFFELQHPPAEFLARWNPVPFDPTKVEDLKTQLQSGKRRDGLVVVLTDNTQSLHLHKGSLVKQLERSPIGPIFSLSQLPLILSKESLDERSESCANLNDGDFLSRADCIVFRFSKQHLRRKLDPTKLYGAVERYGLKEYLVFIHQP